MTLRSHSPKPPKLKVCKVCKCNFLAPSGLQRARVCGQVCAGKIGREQREKAEKARQVKENRETRAKLEKLKSRAQWAKEAQDAVNKYVRLRDAQLGCVSCDKPESWDGQWHASHFRSVGAATAVRFHLWNIHKSCSVCNNWKSGNLSEYEPRLREKIGDERVDWLRTQNQLASYSIDYLKRLKQVMTKKAKRLEARHGSR